MISGLIRKKLGRITKNVLMRVQVRTSSRKTTQADEPNVAKADASVAKTNAANLPKMTFFRRVLRHNQQNIKQYGSQNTEIEYEQH